MALTLATVQRCLLNFVTNFEFPNMLNTARSLVWVVAVAPKRERVRDSVV